MRSFHVVHIFEKSCERRWAFSLRFLQCSENIRPLVIAQMLVLFIRDPSSALYRKHQVSNAEKVERANALH